MSLFVIADLHLSLNGEKPMDVFRGWHNYVERLEDNWRRVVQEGDTVVIAGDISWAMKLEDAVQDFQFLHSLPGEKILLKGNHDYWWSTRSKIDQFQMCIRDRVSPFEAITPRKQRKIIATAQEYLRQHPSGLQPRFDAAAVHLQEGTVVGQEYLENAFWG